MTNDMQKNHRKSTTSKIVIWVAIIGLVGTLGAALIANWDKFFPSASTQDELPDEMPGTSKLKPKVELEKLASKWLVAVLDNDVETVVNLSSEPFYFDNEIILTKQKLRSKLLAAFSEMDESPGEITVSSIKVQTARELKEQGYDLSVDRIFPSMNLTLNDYAVVVTWSNQEGLIMMARQINESFEIVGFWN
jgi:hypothetical protein